MKIPNKFNRLGVNEYNLIDNHVKFLIYGNLTDKIGNVQIDNHGLLSDGKYIYSPDETSYAVIPANSLSADILASDHDFSFEIMFYIPENQLITRRVGIFGSFNARFDILYYGNYLGIGGMGTGIYNLIIPGNNLFTVNYRVNTGYSFKLNGNAVTPSNIEDLTTARNIRNYPQGILANLYTNGNPESYAFMIKIKYIRISDIVR